MKPSDQLVKNLKNLGFSEIKPNLFSKRITSDTSIYRDYRKRYPDAYAYQGTKKIYPYQFKEIGAIRKIEQAIELHRSDKLHTYIDPYN